MKLAIVFGTYNRLAVLPRAIASVRAAVGTIPYELIVVDGGSTDGSREWLASQRDVVLLGQRGPLTGAVRAFNLGFAYAVDNGFDFVAHLNDDAEIVTPKALEKAVELLKSDATIGEVAFAFDLYGNWSFDHVNGKPYANFGVIRREAGIQVAQAQGDHTGRHWWNQIYRTYGADSEFGVWLWKLGWTVHTANDLRVHDLQVMDALRDSNDALNPERLDSKIFWNRWGTETFETATLATAVRAPKHPRPIALVTGAFGFLGKHLVHELEKDSNSIVLPVRSDQTDLRSRDDTRRLFNAVNPDVVYHLAATCGGIGANQLNPGSFCRDNLLMGINVLDAAHECKTRKTVLVGTVCAYPKFTPVPFDVKDLWNGYPEETNAPYGIAKRTIGVLAEAYKKQYDLNVVTAILANLYGPGDNFDLETSHVIPALIRKFVEAKQQDTACVVLWGNGTPTREFLHVQDAARALKLVADTYEENEPINIGTGAEISIASLAGTIAALVGYQGAIDWDTTRPNGQPRRMLNVDVARELLGFSAAIPLKAGLEETIEWYKALSERKASQCQ